MTDPKGPPAPADSPEHQEIADGFTDVPDVDGSHPVEVDPDDMRGDGIE